MPQEVFRYYEIQNFRRETRYPLLYMKLFDTPSFRKHWADAHKTFRHCETKSFQLKNVIPPTMHKISGYPKLSETLKGCPQIISALSDHKFSPERCDTPLCIKFLLPQFIWNIERMPTEIFGNVRQSFFDGNLLYPLLSMKCFDTSNYLKHWRDAPRSFSVLWDPKFSQKKRGILYYTWNLSIPQLFWNIERKPTKNFGTVRQKIFQLKNPISLTMQNFFRYPQIIWILEGMPTKFFGSLRPKSFAGKTWYPSLYKKLFNTPTFLKHWTEAHKKFRHCETKNFQLKNAISFTMRKFFRYPQTIWIIERMPTKIFGARRPKIFAEKTCYFYYV